MAARQSNPSDFLDGLGYCARLEDNLLPSVPHGSFEADYLKGAGRELEGKMRAPHSSAALVVNTFAPWRSALASLTLRGVTGFRRLEFESVCPSGLRGTPPHLDVVAEGARSVAVESKCLEYLTPPVARFSTVYESVRDARRDSPWYRLLLHLREDPRRFRYVDAAQLVKHFLGVSLRFQEPPATLLYVFWEPANRMDFAEFAEHRRELEELRESTSSCRQMRFEFCSYADIWREWDEPSAPSWLADHSALWRARYAIGV